MSELRTFKVFCLSEDGEIAHAAELATPSPEDARAEAERWLERYATVEIWEESVLIGRLDRKGG